MIRFLLVFLLSFSVLLSKDDINTKIKSTNKEIGSFSKNYTKLNQKMAKTAKAILKQKLTITKATKVSQGFKSATFFKGSNL